MVILISKRIFLHSWFSLLLLLFTQDCPSLCAAFTATNKHYFPNCRSLMTIQPVSLKVSSRLATKILPTSSSSSSSLPFRLISPTASPLVLLFASPFQTSIVNTNNRTKSQLNWINKYNQLKEFHQQYGHTNVPQCGKKQDKTLGSWVNTQRAWYKKITKKDGTLIKFNEFHQERIDLLNKIGFVWTQNALDNYKWMTAYNQLQEFYKKYGHTNVPNDWRHNKYLGSWVSRQRTWYHKNTNEFGELIKFDRDHQERISLLESIGFEWSINSLADHKWMLRYNELMDFYKEHGHTNVPFRWEPNEKLGSWVCRQRTWYQKITNRNGKLIKKYDTKFHQDRIDMLDALGFEWHSNSLSNYNWMTKYNELKIFYKEYGHSNVPINWEPNEKLGAWVSNQRTWFKNFTKNQNVELATTTTSKHQQQHQQYQERIDLLNEIDFEWNAISSLKNSKWMIRYNELKEFYKEHGHTNVPINYERNEKLGAWVNKQRSWHYNLTNKYGELYKRNKSHQDRIDLLEDIYFQWTSCSIPT